MTPAQRVHLDRRIVEERMIELPEHGVDPCWAGTYVEEPRVWTMNAAGEMSADWTWIDYMDWSGVVAVRMEFSNGSPAPPPNDDDDDG